MRGKAWELRKEVFNLEGSYTKNKARFHVTHSLPSWLKKKRAHIDDSSPKVATTKRPWLEKNKENYQTEFRQRPYGSAQGDNR